MKNLREYPASRQKWLSVSLERYVSLPCHFGAGRRLLAIETAVPHLSWGSQSKLCDPEGLGRCCRRSLKLVRSWWMVLFFVLGCLKMRRRLPTRAFTSLVALCSKCLLNGLWANPDGSLVTGVFTWVMCCLLILMILSKYFSVSSLSLRNAWVSSLYTFRWRDYNILQFTGNPRRSQKKLILVQECPNSLSSFAKPFRYEEGKYREESLV